MLVLENTGSGAYAVLCA